MTAARILAPAAFVLLALTGCGGGGSGAAARTQADPFKEVSRQPSLTRTARRAAPRWARVTSFAGTAPATRAIAISSHAIQWRARWRCRSGRLAMTVEPKPRTAADGAGGRCPRSGETDWVQTGNQRLHVDASGPWSVTVEQQLDTPLHEAPLAAMRAAGARVVARGSFRPVERQGTGKVLLYRLADRRTALRLDPFRTSSNTDLFVWLSTSARPATTKDIVRASRIGALIPLKSTIGEQNYVLPASTRSSAIRSIAIWCAPIQIVYTTAALKR
jgi:hypothetical protein